MIDVKTTSRKAQGVIASLNPYGDHRKEGHIANIFIIKWRGSTGMLENTSGVILKFGRADPI
jgi:hypothetical protein